MGDSLSDGITAALGVLSRPREMGRADGSRLLPAGCRDPAREGPRDEAREIGFNEPAREPRELGLAGSAAD